MSQKKDGSRKTTGSPVKTSKKIVRRLGKILGPEFCELEKRLTLKSLSKRSPVGSHNLTDDGD